MTTFYKADLSESPEDWQATRITEGLGSMEEHQDGFWRKGPYGIERDGDGTFEAYVLVADTPFKVGGGFGSFEEAVQFLTSAMQEKSVPSTEEEQTEQDDAPSAPEDEDDSEEEAKKEAADHIKTGIIVAGEKGEDEDDEKVEKACDGNHDVLGPEGSTSIGKSLEGADCNEGTHKTNVKLEHPGVVNERHYVDNHTLGSARIMADAPSLEAFEKSVSDFRSLMASKAGEGSMYAHSDEYVFTKADEMTRYEELEAFEKVATHTSIRPRSEYQGENTSPDPGNPNRGPTWTGDRRVDPRYADTENKPLIGKQTPKMAEPANPVEAEKMRRGQPYIARTYDSRGRPKLTTFDPRRVGGDPGGEPIGRDMYDRRGWEPKYGPQTTEPKDYWAWKNDTAPVSEMQGEATTRGSDAKAFWDPGQEKYHDPEKAKERADRKLGKPAWDHSYDDPRPQRPKAQRPEPAPETQMDWGAVTDAASGMDEAAQRNRARQRGKVKKSEDESFEKKEVPGLFDPTDYSYAGTAREQPTTWERRERGTFEEVPVQPAEELPRNEWGRTLVGQGRAPLEDEDKQRMDEIAQASRANEIIHEKGQGRDLSDNRRAQLWDSAQARAAKEQGLNAYRDRVWRMVLPYIQDLPEDEQAKLMMAAREDPTGVGSGYLEEQTLRRAWNDAMHDAYQGQYPKYSHPDIERTRRYTPESVRSRQAEREIHGLLNDIEYERQERERQEAASAEEARQMDIARAQRRSEHRARGNDPSANYSDEQIKWVNENSATGQQLDETGRIDSQKAPQKKERKPRWTKEQHKVRDQTAQAFEERAERERREEAKKNREADPEYKAKQQKARDKQRAEQVREDLKGKPIRENRQKVVDPGSRMNAEGSPQKPAESKEDTDPVQKSFKKMLEAKKAENDGKKGVPVYMSDKEFPMSDDKVVKELYRTTVWDNSSAKSSPYDPEVHKYKG